jgi:hypothetical protein
MNNWILAAVAIGFWLGATLLYLRRNIAEAIQARLARRKLKAAALARQKAEAAGTPPPTPRPGAPLQLRLRDPDGRE